MVGVTISLGSHRARLRGTGFQLDGDVTAQGFPEFFLASVAVSVAAVIALSFQENCAGQRGASMIVPAQECGTGMSVAALTHRTHKKD
jgi:hypothetical protein